MGIIEELMEIWPNEVCDIQKAQQKRGVVKEKFVELSKC